MMYNYRFEIVSVVISCILLLSHFKHRLIKTRTIRLFGVITTLVFISSIADIISIILLINPTRYPLALHRLVNTIYQTSFHPISFVYYLLMYSLTQKDSKPKIQIEVLISIPYLISFVLDTTNFVTNYVFYFDADMKYTQGPFLFYMYVQAWIYVVMGVVLSFVRRNRFSKTIKNTLYFYTFASLICVTLQWFFPNLLIMGFVISISILLTFLCLENPQDYYDKEMNTYNRIAFTTVCQNLLNLNKKFKVIGIKFEEMKYLNDTIGMENRANLMRSIAAFLIQNFGKKNVFRLSRSKVALIITSDDIKYQKQLDILQKRFLNPFDCGTIKISLTVFLDCVHCPEESDNIEDILDLLENSFDDFLSLEKLTISRANKAILEKRKRENYIRSVLEEALQNDGFEIVYQPIFSITERKYKSAEALLRLKEKKYGKISPQEFIPVAEKNGLILKIGTLVFKEVCRFISTAKIWEAGIEYIHINLSVVQCMQDKLYEQLIEIMDYYDLPYNYINLDITETSANASKENLKKNMEILLQKHIGFSLDDYGTGYSNTSNLINYAFNTVKLDKTLIWDALRDEKARVILNQLIKMIKALGMNVIAEGVETKEQVELVSSLNCDYIQGYYYSYPLPEKDFLLFMN